MADEREREGAQSTVELALVLPIVAMVALGMLNVGLLMRDNVLCVHAAREAARALAVGEDPVAAAQVRSGLGSALIVTVDASTGMATVELRVAGRLPVFGRFLPGARLRQSASMRREAQGRAPNGLSEGQSGLAALR